MLRAPGDKLEALWPISVPSEALPPTESPSYQVLRRTTWTAPRFSSHFLDLKAQRAPTFLGPRAI